MRKRIINLLVLSSLSLLPAALTTGCAVARHQETAGEYGSDAKTTARIKTALYKDPVVKGTEVKVSTMRGVVQLSGWVDSDLLNRVRATNYLHGIGTDKSRAVLTEISRVDRWSMGEGLFWLAFRVLTAHDAAWSDLWIGAAAAAVLWAILQALGVYIVGHQLKSASNIYGTFALVIGLLSWMYLAAHITLLCAETPA